MNLHELIKGLPIKVISRDEVEFEGELFRSLDRAYLERQINNEKRPLEFRVRDRLLLALMDQQQPIDESKVADEISREVFGHGTRQQPAPEWKVGDWFRCDGEQGITQVQEVIDEATLLATNRTFYKAEFCRHVPPPEPKTLGDLEREERVDREIADLKIKIGNLERQVNRVKAG